MKRSAARWQSRNISPPPSRSAGATAPMQPVSREKDTFSTGIVSFTNEGKLLAQFDHPALVRVYRCWEERGTPIWRCVCTTG